MFRSQFFPRPTSTKEELPKETVFTMSSSRTATWGSGRHQPAETIVEIKQTGATTRHQDEAPGSRQDTGDDSVPQLVTFKTEQSSHDENKDAKTTTARANKESGAVGNPARSLSQLTVSRSEYTQERDGKPFQKTLKKKKKITVTSFHSLVRSLGGNIWPMIGCASLRLNEESQAEPFHKTFSQIQTRLSELRKMSNVITEPW